MELHPAETTVICTDSLPVHAVLKKDNWRDCQDWTRKIIIQSRRVKGFITILWVPSHYGVDGIEKADSLADKGTKLKQKDIPITHDIARAKIKKQKWQILHKRAKEIFKDNLKPKFSVEKKWTRKAQSLF